MDWTVFWTGVGALGGVGAVVVTVVVFRRGQPRVVVEATRNEIFTAATSERHL